MSSENGRPMFNGRQMFPMKKKPVRVTVIDYDEKHLEERRVSQIEDVFPFKKTDTVTWINIDGVHDIELIEKVGNHFGMHPLLIEDILDTTKRPKTVDYGDYLFTIMRTLSFNKLKEKIEAEQISIVLGKNFVISFQEREGDVFDKIREDIRNEKGKIRKSGPDYLVYSLLDATVENCFAMLEGIENQIQELQDKLVGSPSATVLKKIHYLRLEVLHIRKTIWPLRETVNSLYRSESKLIQKSTRLYLRDVYENTIQAIENMDILWEMTIGMIDTYLSSASNRMNEVMKVLTIISTIFIPLTFITGIYGMNFKNLPELEWENGYYMALGGMLSIALFMLYYFKKKKWL